MQSNRSAARARGRFYYMICRLDLPSCSAVGLTVATPCSTRRIRAWVADDRGVAVWACWTWTLSRLAKWVWSPEFLETLSTVEACRMPQGFKILFIHVVRL